MASAFLAIGQGARWGDRVPEKEVLLPLDQPSGHDYWALMDAGRTICVRRAGVGGAQGGVAVRRP